ncbi:hypothetical protein WJX79_002791 [Trebouxia sp. C0005]
MRRLRPAAEHDALVELLLLLLCTVVLLCGHAASASTSGVSKAYFERKTEDGRSREQVQGRATFDDVTVTQERVTQALAKGMARSKLANKSSNANKLFGLGGYKPPNYAPLSTNMSASDSQHQGNSPRLLQHGSPQRPPYHLGQK